MLGVAQWRNPLRALLSNSLWGVESHQHQQVWKRILPRWSLQMTHMCMHAKLLQLCPTLCDPKDCSLPGSSVHGIPQARILKWAAMPSSRGFSQPRGQTCVSYASCIGRWVLYHQRHLDRFSQYLQHGLGETFSQEMAAWSCQDSSPIKTVRS